jgi:hypothetical protein
MKKCCMAWAAYITFWMRTRQSPCQWKSTLMQRWSVLYMSPHSCQVLSAAASYQCVSSGDSYSGTAHVRAEARALAKLQNVTATGRCRQTHVRQTSERHGVHSQRLGSYCTFNTRLAIIKSRRSGVRQCHCTPSTQNLHVRMPCLLVAAITLKRTHSACTSKRMQRPCVLCSCRERPASLRLLKHANYALPQKSRDSNSA